MALENMLYDDNTASETFELYGPKNYSMAEIKELVERETLRHRRQINLPKRIYKPLANLVNKAIWWPMISADEVERECFDQVIDPKAKTFKDLGIQPAELSNLTFHYLVGFALHISFYRMLIWPWPLSAKLPQLIFLRSASGNRAREAGGEEVPSCH